MVCESHLFSNAPRSSPSRNSHPISNFHTLVFAPFRNLLIPNDFHTLRKNTGGIPQTHSTIEDRNETATKRTATATKSHPVSPRMPSHLRFRPPLPFSRPAQRKVLPASHRRSAQSQSGIRPHSPLRTEPSQFWVRLRNKRVPLLRRSPHHRGPNLRPPRLRARLHRQSRTPYPFRHRTRTGLRRRRAATHRFRAP